MYVDTTLKKLRKNAGLTQKELANKTGLSLRSIINYENGLREPNSKAMAALEKFFNVSGAYLRGETQEQEPMFQWEDIEKIEVVKDCLPDFFSKIENEIRTLPDRELKYSNDVLVELSHAINKKDAKMQTMALRLAGLSIYVSNTFIDCYKSSWPELPDDERLEKSYKLALDGYKQALDYISKQIKKENISV